MSATLDPINGLVYVPQLRDLEVERYQQCNCCPYGYHIDLDFVRYCEALSHGNATPTTKQKCRERRRQRHSMEVLLGLISPSLWSIEQQLPEIPQEESPLEEKFSINQEELLQDALGKAVEVFEDTLQRTHKRPSAQLNADYSYDTHDGALHGQWPHRKRGAEELADSESTVMRVTSVGDSASGKIRRRPGWNHDTQPDQMYSSRENEANDTAQHDSDAASVGSATSNVSTLQIHPELQNIREQMAVSLERMRELEEQVKLIPILQIQLAILKEEKRVLTQKLQENGGEYLKVDNKFKGENGYMTRKNEHCFNNEDKQDADRDLDEQQNNSECKIHYSQTSSLSPQDHVERKNTEPKSVKTSFRHRGITCAVVTRDVGVSHLHPKTRNTGTNTHEFPKKLSFSGMRRENILPDLMLVDAHLADRTKTSTKSNEYSKLDSFKESETPLKLEDVICPPITKKNVSVVTDLHMDDIDLNHVKSSKEKEHSRASSSLAVTSTASQTVDLLKPVLRITEHSDSSIQVSDELYPPAKHQVKIHRINVGVQCDYKVVKHAGIQYDFAYWQSTKGIQYEAGQWVKDASIQAGQLVKQTVDVGLDVKPRSLECGVEAKVITRDKGTSATIESLCEKCSVPKCSIGVGQSDTNEVKLINISLNSLNVSANKRILSNTEDKSRTETCSVACGPDWKFLTSRSTDTYDLAPRRDTGSNTVHKQFKDASVNHTPEQLPNELNGDSHGITSPSKDTLSPETGILSHSRIPRLTRPISPTISVHTTTKLGSTVVSTYEKTHKPVSPTPPNTSKTSSVLSPSVPKLYSRKLSPTNNSAQEKSQDSGNTRHTLQRQSTYTKLPEVTEIYSEHVEMKNDHRVEPSKEMKAALKVLNDYFKKHPSKKDLPKHLTNASNIVQQEWFKISGGKAVNPLAVEDYLDYIERCSAELLEYVVNMTDISGNTALHYAVSSGNFDVVSILLDSKVCNVNKRNAAGYTCVMLATLVKLRCETHRQIIRRMFHMADVNIKAKPHSQTALMLATSHGSLEMVEMLTEAGADMNIQDADGSTALMCAADHGFIDIVKHIIAQPDCDVTLTDSDGCTALNIAMESGNRQIGFLLYAHEHFSQGNSPHGSLRSKRSRSSTPTSKNNTLQSGRSGGTPVPSEHDKSQP